MSASEQGKRNKTSGPALRSSAGTGQKDDQAQGAASAPAADHTTAAAPSGKNLQVHSQQDTPQPPDNEPDRLAQPLDLEQPPRLPFPVIGIGASAGGLEAFIDFFSAQPANSGLAFVLIQHLPPERESMVADILARHTKMPVRQVEDNMAIEADHVYVIRPGRTMTIRDGRLHLGEPLEKPGHRRPVDDFFRSLAEEQRERAVAVIMSGMGSNGSAGAQAIKAVGGVCIAQDPESAKFPAMPRSLIDTGNADMVLRPRDIPEVLARYASHPYAKSRSAGEELLQRERQSLGEILSILRVRARQEFNGYKKPTVLRRIQRRMGLHHVFQLSEYAKLLRQNPSEAAALADDLVIHVTGFFRDPSAWETLHHRVIIPMVNERAEDSTIRAWVTACSSGEEAYTLAMLITEAVEATGKAIDIKVFATDLADRVLSQARAGIYPAGIEGEIPQQRLDRFFEKDDSFYRIRKELRERVVFASQNVLQDPPFSRLDICTCRNLLIYLEPEVQRRVLGMMHFGLREGGVLFLGNSETVTGMEELYEPVDKKWRIYRRVGPTRHGDFEFPLLLTSAGQPVMTGEPAAAGPRPAARPSIAQLTQRALLDLYTPPAVVVDRQFRVLYFHGDTHAYLRQPAGEPTRELLAMSRETVRGAVRVALHRAMQDNNQVTVRDGLSHTTEGTARVSVTVTPLEPNHGPAVYFLVSFHEASEAATTAGAGTTATAPESRRDGNGDSGAANAAIAAAEVSADEQRDELQRIRDELQSTIEELQTSNEELKASNEEVTSVNEELQSTNEELETSKEELQSLNEELTTVNSQLRAKMDELQATTNDLSSLLTSTDIAVVFLDMHLRIRRYTPAVLDLIDLIPSDNGRPLSDLARKFDDPDLISDAHAVLDKLVPREKELMSESGRWYVRRLLPYRTADHRINGVVITFLDISRVRAAEALQRRTEERYRLIVQGVQEFAIIMLSPDGHIEMWNAGAQRVLGYSEAEAVGQDGAVIFTAEDRAAGVPAKELELARNDGRSQDEHWYVRADGSRFWGSGVTAALRDADGGLRGFVKIMRDNTDRKRAEEQLLAARRAAEAANTAKDHFLATVSHELRTPLSAILLWSKMLLEGKLPREQSGEGLKAIELSAEAQRRLIDDLLDNSRISAGKLRLNMQPTDLGGVVHAAIEAIRPAASAKSITIGESIDKDVGFVQADAERVQQMVWNLLSNAVKFTPAGGQVTVGLRRRERGVEIQVADTGKGISREFLPHLFERFKQAEDVHTRTAGGLGLGLAITKQLVELHGGTIEAASPGPDQGATFTVRLPLPELSDKLTASASVAAARDKEAEPSSQRIRGLRVLLVEDNVESARAFAAALEANGAKPTIAHSGTEALRALEQSSPQSPPQVIVSDIAMPDMDGYAFLREVRAREAREQGELIPAVAVSAFAREEDQRRAIESGFQAHIAKPMDIERLLQVLAALAPQK